VGGIPKMPQNKRGLTPLLALFIILAACAACQDGFDRLERGAKKRRPKGDRNPTLTGENGEYNEESKRGGGYVTTRLRKADRGGLTTEFWGRLKMAPTRRRTERAGDRGGTTGITTQHCYTTKSLYAYTAIQSYPFTCKFFDRRQPSVSENPI
jgi:hypothetical protein